MDIRYRQTEPLKELLQGQLQGSLGNGGPGKEKSPGYVRAITR